MTITNSNNSLTVCVPSEIFDRSSDDGDLRLQDHVFARTVPDSDFSMDISGGNVESGRRKPGDSYVRSVLSVLLAVGRFVN